jgi:chemotaxis protein CheX
MRAHLDEQSVINANAQFWEQMLAMSLEPVQPQEELQIAGRHMLGSVNLSGVWKGRVEVRLGEGLAQQATAAMLMQPVETVVETVMLDATKEIANMIGGVIKSSLPRPCNMTVPESGVETAEFTNQAQADDSLVVGFRHSAGDLMVRVWEEEFVEQAA